MKVNVMVEKTIEVKRDIRADSSGKEKGMKEVKENERKGQALVAREAIECGLVYEGAERTVGPDGA